MLTRRQLIGATAGLSIAATLAGCATVRGGNAVAPRARTHRMLMNSGFSGANAWFAVAHDKGYLRDEGIEIEFTPGRGAYTAAPRIAAEGFDIGYGDINSLVEVATRSSGSAPVGVYMMFNATPSTIVVAADSEIRVPRDMESRRFGAHPTDVALNTFPAFARATGVDVSRVMIVPSGASMKDLVVDMLAGNTDGVFGYFSTQTAAAMTAGIDPSARLRFLRYDSWLPDFYGSALMASADLVRTDPEAVRKIVRAFNRGVVDCARDPGAAIEAVMRRDATLNRDVELSRLTNTLRHEMNHPERRLLGIGDVDDARLVRSIRTMVETKTLPATPGVRAIFNRAFLPPRQDRQI